MPRKYQAPKAQASQAYGERTEQIQAQRQMPLPNTGPTPPQPSASGPMGPDVIEMARQLQPGTPLMAASERPDEPVTAGMVQGAGPGPEALGNFATIRRNQAAETLQFLADLTGDPTFAHYANKARQDY